MASVNPDLSFVDAAHAFAAKNRSKFIFKALKYYTGCNDYELDFLIKKIYCTSISSSEYLKETFIKKYLGVLLLPLFFLINKRWNWKQERPVDYNFETVDRSYFDSRFSVIYDNLTGSKRITPRIQGSHLRGDVTEPVTSAIHIRSLVLLFIIAPAVIFPLYAFCLQNRINILRAYRASLAAYAEFDGYFKRYPCKSFITYADDTNHPSYYIAFKQNCAGNMIVIQNGERSYHPRWSFGMLDVYFIFGESYIDMIRRLGYHVGYAIPVGSLALNQYYHLLQNMDEEHLFDILYIDNGSICPPSYGGLTEEVAKSEEIILSHLNKFKSIYKNLKIAYQLRNYDSEQKEQVLSILRNILSDDIEILDNSGQGESYRNIRKSNLVINFQSTMGFEAFMLGKKALFVNYSGHANQTLYYDGLFQIEDTTHDFKLFEERVKCLLDLNLDKIPDFAIKRHYAFDGQVQERIAKAISEIQAGGCDDKKYSLARSI